MLIAILDIPFYDQLRRVSPEAVEALGASVRRLATGAFDPLYEHRGRYAFGLATEPIAELREALSGLLALRRELDASEIADHACLIFDGRDMAVAAVEQEADRLLCRLEAAAGERRSEGISPLWRRAVVIHVSAAPLLRLSQTLSGEGEFLGLQNVAGEKAAAAAPDRATSRPMGFARPNPVNRIVEAAFASIAEEGSHYPVMVSGRDGVGKVRCVREAARKIVGEEIVTSIVAIHTVFNRRSAIHPFLNSIRRGALEETPRYLRSWELRVWERREGLLRALTGGLPRGGEGPTAVPPLCPDRLSVDFFSGYRLYLLAYLRAMEGRDVPALVLFEDIHTYHPEALRFTHSLVRDLLRHPSFLPVLTCRDDHDACGLFGTEVLAVPVHPVSLDEIKGAAEAMYPGVRLQEKAARRIKASSGGRLLAVGHYLHHLERSGKIAASDRTYSWVTGGSAQLPPDPAAAAWEEIEALPRPARELLFLCSLAGGIGAVHDLEDLARQIDPAREEGRAAASAPSSSGSSLRPLADAGLIRSPEEPIFLFPRLRAKLEAALGEWASRARAVFAERLVESWRSGRMRNLVLVFSALRNDRLDVAIDVLGELVSQKLDELNVRGCHFFLDPAKLRIPSSAPEAQRERYACLAALGELRSHLLLGAWQRAEQAMDRVSNLDIPEARGRDVAQRALEQARFHLVKSDAPAATKAAKTAVIQFHEAGDERGERRAEAELGASLLAEGRLEEALDYLGFVTRSPAAEPFPRVRSASLSAIAAYLLGNVSGSVRLAEEGARLADAAGRREWQALVMFLRGRQLFDLGKLDAAASALQELLCFARVYGMDHARTVATAWMGRSLAYAGSWTQAIRLLQSLGDSGEGRFFRAESLYLQGQVQPALRLLESPETLRRRQAMHPGERVSWENGFASVEERCVALRRGGGTLLRLVRGFRAYLTALDGRPEQAMRELYRITREERVSDLDPYLPLYSYWYATTLPEEGGEGTDHKLTVLNRAMKHLQQRSSRVEDARDRWQLMTANYWNARLLEEARARRLA